MELVNPRLETRVRRDRAKQRARCVGIAAIVFGVIGVAIACLFLELDASGATAGSAREVGPRGPLGALAIVAHAYLVVAGLRLTRGKTVRTLPYFFAIESAYAAVMIFLMPGIFAAARMSPVEARCSMSVNLGFMLQLVTGFPLWGWLLTRSYGSRGSGEQSG
jgi:hypothetical protein